MTLGSLNRCNAYILVSRRLAGPRHLHYLRREIVALLHLGYQVRWSSLNASDYGVPQHRSRLILVAAKNGLTLPSLPSPTHGVKKDAGAQDKKLKLHLTVHDAIGDLIMLDNPRIDNDGMNPKFCPDEFDLAPYVQRLRQVEYIGPSTTGACHAPFNRQSFTEQRNEVEVSMVGPVVPYSPNCYERSLGMYASE